MAGRDLKAAAERVKERKEILKRPIIRRPDAPENLHISYAEFVAKRKAEKEEALAVEEFKKNYRSKKENTDGLQKEGQEKEVKRGRPKKVE